MSNLMFLYAACWCRSNDARYRSDKILKTFGELLSKSFLSNLGNTCRVHRAGDILPRAF